MSPPWLKELEKAPKSQVIVGSIVGATVLATVLWGIQTASTPKLPTMSDEWIAANKEYMKFQKMNPIFGISRKD